MSTHTYYKYLEFLRYISVAVVSLPLLLTAYPNGIPFQCSAASGLQDILATGPGFLLT